MYENLFQLHNRFGNRVYHYYLTYREYYNTAEDWYGVYHGADIQVSLFNTFSI